MKIILMGTGPFAVPSFDAIAAAGHDVRLVVTRPVITTKSRQGPPPAPVRDWASGKGLAIFDPTSINDAESVDRLTEIAADLMVVCDYGQILSPAALATTPLGGINLHGSLLPKYRGAAPVQWAVLNGDLVAGVSVLHMTPRLDGGPLLATAETAIAAHETAGQLEQRLSMLGVDPTLQSIALLDQWDRDHTIGLLQDPASVTKAPRLKKSDGAIDWGRTASELGDHVRGMQPWPVAFTQYRPTPGKTVRIAVLRIGFTELSSEDHAAGELLQDESGRWRVAAGDQFVDLLEIQPAGKRPMSAEDYFRGNPPPLGSRLFG